MKRVLVPLADGFEEIEAVTVVDVLRRAGCQVSVAGLKGGEVLGARKMRILPDKSLEEALQEDYDVIILPGGQPGTDHLRKDKRILEILRKMNEKGKIIGAICAAPMVLRDAGLTAGRKITSYPGFEESLSGSRYQEARVVTDGNMVTSRGPGTAMEFALKLVELLLDKEKAKALSDALVFEQA